MEILLKSFFTKTDPKLQNLGSLYYFVIEKILRLLPFPQTKGVHNFRI